jgi:hypothetical protein
MRKVFWLSTGCGVLMVFGVVATANHAARYPRSIIGRVLHGASHIAARLSPMTGFAPMLAKSQITTGDVIAGVDGIPEEPEPVPEAVAPAEKTDPAEVSAAPIVIPDEDRGPIEPVAGEHVVVPFEQAECPPAAAQVAPATMPYCRDEEECEVLPMPREECELLPMPEIEFNERNYEIDVEQPRDGNPADECRQDPHHHHTAVCPYTGQSYPACTPDGRCPSMNPQPCNPPKKAGAEEPSEPQARSPHQSALRKIRLFKEHEPIDDLCPTHPEVDTMEYRASDGQLYDYGRPGAL